MWCAEHGLLSAEVLGAFAEEVRQVHERSGNPADLYRAMGGVLSTEELNAAGQAFATRYLDLDTGQYLDDYVELLTEEYPTAYHVPDTWDNYEKLSHRIGERFKEQA